MYDENNIRFLSIILQLEFLRSILIIENSFRDLEAEDH